MLRGPIPWLVLPLLAQSASTQANGLPDLAPRRTRPAQARSGVQVENLGLASSYGLLDGDTVVLFVSESMEERDLNGDGDMQDDHVPHVHSLSTGVTIPLGLSAFCPCSFEGGYFLYVVSESGQGLTDLNGDGDVSDFVFYLYDTATGTNTNLGLAGFSFFREGNHVLLLVSEAMQGGMDLDGDGMADHLVLHELDLQSSAVTNLGAGGSSSFDWAGGIVFFCVSEGGVRDLNLDGDTLDNVAFTYDPASNTTTNLGLASHQDLGLDQNYALFTVSEAEQGSSDLNGDGDALDSLSYLYDSRSQTTRNLGVDVLSGSISNERVWMTVREDHRDLNHDGDLLDAVLELYDICAGSILNLAIATPYPLVHGDRGMFRVSEQENGGVDLNGDGDSLDYVPHTYDASTGTLQNLGFAVLDSPYQLSFDANQYVTRIQESSNGGIDLNDDGDAQDGVVAIYRFSSATTEVLGLAAGSAFLDDGFAFFTVVEPFQGGTDLNGDGDALDYCVPFAYDLKRRLLFNSKVSGSFGDAARIQGPAFLVSANEYGQGEQDLNGDGDVLDDVLQVIELHRP